MPYSGAVHIGEIENSRIDRTIKKPLGWIARWYQHGKTGNVIGCLPKHCSAGYPSAAKMDGQGKYRQFRQLSPLCLEKIAFDM